MNRNITFLLIISSFLLFANCNSEKKDKNENHAKSKPEEQNTKLNLLTDIEPLFQDGDVNAIIEIPAGTVDKWELDKSTGELQWEVIDNKPRVIHYIGYPGNYGMIPKTLLSKENGGDGDPLDILVLGPPAERGHVLKCKIIGVLYLTDSGEQDDKLIAVSNNSPLYGLNTIDDLNKEYTGISEIVQLWFTNYKGPGKMESKGFGSQEPAMQLLTEAIDGYKLNNTKNKN